jgi:hypothetical protein
MGERKIMIYCGSVLNYAVAMFPEGAQEAGLADHDVHALEQLLWEQRTELMRWFHERGVQYTLHPPHAENLDESGDR